MNNDGLRDLFVAQSHVLDTVEKSTAYLKYKQPLLLMTNTGKGFVNVSATAGAAFNTAVAARGAAFGDPRIVVGLGNAKAVKSIEVRWPSGRVQTIANPGIDRYLQISEAK